MIKTERPVCDNFLLFRIVIQAVILPLLRVRIKHDWGLISSRGFEAPGNDVRLV